MKVKWKIRYHIKPGDIGYLTYLHGILYAKEIGYDQTFEAYVAGGLAEFVKSFSPHKDRIWLAEAHGRIIGSIAIVRHSEVDVQLRWVLGYWLSERQPVTARNTAACSYCEFKETCSKR